MSQAVWHEGLLSELTAFSVVARRRLAGGAPGEQRSSRLGGGLEFADHRPYVPGDDIRALDWNAYRAHRKLFIRQFEEQQDLSISLLLDCSASIGFGDGAKFFAARRLALALAYLGLSGLDSVSVHGLFADRVATLPPLRGRGRYAAVLAFLDALTPNGPTELSRALSRVAERSRRRSLAVLITDGYDPRGIERAVDVLVGARFEPILIELEDAGDLRPDASGEVVLVDVETREERGFLLTPGELAALREKAEARRQERARRMRARGVRYARVSVRESVPGILRTLESAGVVKR